VPLREPNPEYPYNYFVSFAHSTGFGWRVTGLKNRIETAADVEELERGIGSAESVAILNWIELKQSPSLTYKRDGSQESTVDGGEQTQ
jgi:hypothetical protein